MKALKSFYLFAILALFLTMTTAKVVAEEEAAPAYLYKVLSLENWNQSLNQENIQLSYDDAQFIHLSKEDQLERIIDKYWKDAAKYFVLKIDPTKLRGQLVYEINPGGSQKYYHLYRGSIPQVAVVETRLVDYTH